MKKTFLLMLTFLLILPLVYVTRGEYANNIFKARNWLENVVYNETVGLCSETEEWNTSFWLHSDNYLVSEALENYYPSLVFNMHNKLAEYGYKGESYFEIVFNGNLDHYPFKSGYAYNVYENNFTVKSWNYSAGNIFSEYEKYSDLCMLKSVHSWLEGNNEESIKMIEKAISYWDGMGFKDETYAGCYDVYRLGLFLASCNVIGYDCKELKSDIELIMWSMQDDDGGVYSHYTGIGEHGEHLKNTEATVFSVLAYKRPFYMHYYENKKLLIYWIR
ncbi:hypothetical protein ES707_10311 [subsurface metagenome]